MGKSSKKSDSKVVVAPDSLNAEKKGKNKRGAEEALQKVPSVKKQKKNGGVAQAVQKEKVLAKTQKKEKDKSSDSDDSSSEEEEKVKVEAKKIVKPTKPPVKESSESGSESESESDEEPPAKGVVPAKKQQAAVKNVSNGVPAKNLKSDGSSSESSEDDSSDDEDPKGKKMPAVKKVQVIKKVESSDSSEEDESSADEEALPAAKKVQPTKKVESSDSSEEDEEPAAAPKNVPAAAAKNKPASSNDSDSDSNDESSDEEKEIPANASLLKKVPAAAVKKTESSEGSDDTSESDESSSEDEGKTKSATPATSKVPPKKGDEEDSSESESDDSDSDEDDAPAPKVTVGSKRPSSVAETKESSDDSEDDDSEESEDEHHKNKKPKATAKKESSSEEESSEDESKKPSKTPKKNDTDVEMVDAATPRTATKQSDLKSANKTPKTPITPQSTGSKTIFVGNLSFQVERADVENFFKEAGEVADVRFALDADEKFRGFGHVEFTTAEAAQNALQLDGQSLLGRNVRLDLARERGDRSSYTPYSKDSNSFQKGGKGQGQTVFIRGFDKSQAEDEIRSALQEHFGTCGEVRRVSIPTDYETGAIKGMAYVEFNDADGFNKALELNGTEFGDQYLTVDEAKPRNDNREGRDNNSGRGRGRGSNNRGRGGRFDGGRGGRFDGGRGGRFDGGRGDRGGRRGRGRGSFSKPSMTAASGTKKTFDDDYE